jgi:hypothetical protein
MDAEHLLSLRQAATALISTAAASTVLAALQTLLTDPAFTTEKPPAPTPAPSLGPRAAPPPRPAATAAAPVVDAAWLDLRAAVKAAMAARGLDHTALGQAIGRSAIGIRIVLGSRKPAPRIVQARLQTWLAEAPTDAPEVAAPLPFPGRGNGHDDVGGAYSGTAD